MFFEILFLFLFASLDLFCSSFSEEEGNGYYAMIDRDSWGQGYYLGER